MPSTYQISMDEPIIVSQATPDVKAWGFYQFPKLTRLPDNRLLLSFQMAPDSALSYGHGGFLHYLSADEGHCWLPAQIEMEDVSDLSLFQGSLSLGDGGLMALRTEKAPLARDLALPKPLGLTFMSYDNTRAPRPLFRWAELPQEMQGLPVSIWREDRWHHFRGTLDVPDDLRACVEGVLPLIFFGNLRRSEDGSILTGVYPNYVLREDGSIDPKCSIAFYRSADEGKNWALQGRLFYQPDTEYDPLGELRRGFTEVSFVEVGEGKLLTVMRTADGSPGMGPLYQSRSNDQGRTWSSPQVIAPFGVEPSLARLGNGMLLLSYGRPGVQVRLCPDGEGKKWLGPRQVVADLHSDPRADTCGYSSLLPLNDSEALIAYSLFLYEGRQGVPVKAIAVRRLRVIRYEEPHYPEPVPCDDALVHTIGNEVACEIPLKERLVTGLSHQYYHNGKLMVSTPFHEGKAHGLQRFYHREGWLMREVPFHEDDKEGPQRVYDRAGNIVEEIFYHRHHPCELEEWIKKSPTGVTSGA